MGKSKDGDKHFIPTARPMKESSKPACAKAMEPDGFRPAEDMKETLKQEPWTGMAPFIGTTTIVTRANGKRVFEAEKGSSSAVMVPPKHRFGWTMSLSQI